MARPEWKLDAPRETCWFPEALEAPPPRWGLEPWIPAQCDFVSGRGPPWVAVWPQCGLCGWGETQGEVEAGRGEKW